jgi:hypothetical protein
MMRDGVDPHLAWCELTDDAATLAAQPAPTVIHFARFEQPFLRVLAGGDPLPDNTGCLAHTRANGLAEFSGQVCVAGRLGSRLCPPK